MKACELNRISHRFDLGMQGILFQKPNDVGETLSWGACDEMRLSVEFVTVGFLGICRQYCCD